MKIGVKTGKKPGIPIAHPGFEGASESVAQKEGVPIEDARKIIAASSRNASPAARAANPRIKKVGS